jgi:hypothetical protein
MFSFSSYYPEAFKDEDTYECKPVDKDVLELFNNRAAAIIDNLSKYGKVSVVTNTRNKVNGNSYDLIFNVNNNYAGYMVLSTYSK